MKNSDLISVIIPCYNHEQYIVDSVQSILEQTYQNIELLIIDDCSTDDSCAKILSIEGSIAKRCTFHQIIRNDVNLGISNTLNKIMQYAKGEYLYLIASDDIALPNAIEVLHSFLSTNPSYALAVGDNIMIDESSQNIAGSTFGQQLRKSRPDINFLSEEFGSYKTILFCNYIPNGYLMNHQALKDVGGWGFPLEDYSLMLKLSKQYKFKYFDKPLFKYRRHSLNTSSNAEKMILTTLQVLQQEKQYALHNGYSKEYYSAFMHHTQCLLEKQQGDVCDTMLYEIKFRDVKKYFRQKIQKFFKR